MNLDSIVAVSDFTAQSAHVLERAALIARQHRIALRLVHLAGSRHTRLTNPLPRLGLRARQLARRHEIAVHAMEQSASLERVLAEARESTLLVIGPLLQRHWARPHLGTVLDQVVRSGVCPMLVVRQAPVRPYQRVLVAIDLSPGSKPLIDFAQRFATPTVMKLFHAVDTIEGAPMRSVRIPLQAIQGNRAGSRLHARDRLSRLLGSLEGAPCMTQTHWLAMDVGHGDPAYSAALHQLATQTELVVVGERHRSALARMFAGSVAQRLARWAAGDVLIAPLDQLRMTAPDAHCC